MKLFDRDGAHVSATLSGNIALGSGGTFRDLFDCQIEIDHCIFCAMYTQNGYYAGGKGYVLEFICDQQLSSADYSISYVEKNSTTGDTTQRTFVFSEIALSSFTNNMSSSSAVRVALSSADINKANVTASQKQLWRYRFSNVQHMVAGSNNMPVQTNFILSVDGAPCILCDANYENPLYTYTNHCYGQYLGFSSGTPRLELSGYYYEQSAWDSWLTSTVGNAGDYANFGLAQFVWLWVLANGNLDTDFDIDTPFNPLPSDFYITVNANSDHEQKGEQSVNFTWTANNSDDTDLSNIDLHFEFSQGAEHVYEMSCGYADESLAVTYRDIVGKLELPWWKNIIQKLPIVGNQLTNSTIMVNIWWNDLTGEAGKCQYLMEYDGRNNSVSIDKAKDPVTEYWTYLTAEDEDIGQTPDEPENPYDGFDFGGGTDSVNGSALLTTSYSLSVSGAHDFGRWLWGTGFDLEQLKMVVNNPIENVVSCKLFPFSITGTASTVKIGNLTSSVSAYYLPENVARTFDFGTIKLDKTNFKLFGNFLDYAPFTTITIYLPYLGFHELDTDLAIGANIGVKYYVDFVTGACRAIVTATKYSELLQQNVTKVLQSFDGNIGQDVPITASNRAQVEAGYIVGGAQAIANFASGIGAIATGNVGGGLSAIGNGITGGIQTAMQMYHSYTNGTPSPALSRFDEQRPYIILDSPVYTEPKGFAHQNGHMCNLTYKLANLHGYTVVDNTVDLSSIPCNFEEREKILELLTSGVYL